MKPTESVCDDEEYTRGNFDEADSCEGQSSLDIDCSPCGKPCPSPLPSEDCFDLCGGSSAQRRGREDHHGSSRRASRSADGGRKPAHSATEIYDSPRSGSARRHRDSFCDDVDMSRGSPSRTSSPHRLHDIDERATSGTKLGASPRGSPRHSPSPRRSPSPHGRAVSEHHEHGREQQQSRRSRSHSRRHSSSRHASSRDKGRDAGLDRSTTKRTRSGSPCCPDIEQRYCESPEESRFLVFFWLLIHNVQAIVNTETLRRIVLFQKKSLSSQMGVSEPLSRRV